LADGLLMEPLEKFQFARTTGTFHRSRRRVGFPVVQEVQKSRFIIAKSCGSRIVPRNVLDDRPEFAFRILEAGRNPVAMMSFPQLRQLSKFVPWVRPRPAKVLAAEHHAASSELLLIFCVARSSPSDSVASCIQAVCCISYRFY
jgi:hypothetical protein